MINMTLVTREAGQSSRKTSGWAEFFSKKKKTEQREERSKKADQSKDSGTEETREEIN